jgi:hypothetical protein
VWPKATPQQEQTRKQEQIKKRPQTAPPVYCFIFVLRPKFGLAP